MTGEAISFIAVTWRSRVAPLPPVGVVGRGPAARALAVRLLVQPEKMLSRLRAVGGASLLLVLGKAGRLPWADGVTYLGSDPRAPSLLLPTTREPAVPPALLERALVTRFAHQAPPLALLDDAPLVVPTGGARPIAREKLQGWLAEQR